jgi:hypothetical protein
MRKDYITRLQGEKILLEETLKNEGFRDGGAYAKTALYRELKLIDKMAEAFERHYGMDEVTANLLACTACEVETPDCDSRNWIETNLSTSWQDEEEYVRGFIEGALEVLAEVDSAESVQD